MFLGTYSHTLDDKGRLILPARIRELLGESVVVTRGTEPCLYVFTTSDFEKFLQEATATGMTGADARALSRYFSSQATEVTPDKQGRIGIIQALRDHAGLNSEVTVIGAYDHVEIWNPSRYAQVDAELVKNVPDIAERENQAMLRLRVK